MSTAPFDAMPVSVRDDLTGALNRTWRRLAEPGAWLDGATRIAIAHEARNAPGCRLCRRRIDALSPYSVDGDHDGLGALTESWLDVVHRVVTDSGRITRRWFDDALAAGMAEDEFVEAVDVAVLVTSVDAFARGIGMDPPALPAPADGVAARSRPENATPGPGWVATIDPEDSGPEVGDLYTRGAPNIRRALTLVPDEALRFWDLMLPLYLQDPSVPELDGQDRAISRAQIEFLAARTSALHNCFY
jgi:hypothetical protein